MGHGSYSTESRSLRSEALGYQTKSANEIFSNKFDPLMNPNGVGIRESRDSEDHPNSVPIIFALDVTGSMGMIPHHLVKEGLPVMMSGIIEAGVLDPQVMFLGIGDHECDYAPLQISQFESNDELLDKWLTKVWIERGGGTNEGESYSLAHYFAAFHTSLDCFEKRGKKGFLFTVGDEPTLRNYPARKRSAITGNGQEQTYSDAELLAEAQKKYHVYHLHMRQGANGRHQNTMDGWKKLLGSNLILVDDKTKIPAIIAQIVSSVEAQSVNQGIEAYNNRPQPVLEPEGPRPTSSDMML